MQVEGIDFFDTFSPVVNWTFSVILSLETKQVDYTTAFLHAQNHVAPNCDDLSE